MLLESYQKTEEIQYYCENCKIWLKATKKYIFQHSSQYLIICLNRFRYNYYKRETEKINNFIDLEDVISVKIGNEKKYYKLIANMNHEGAGIHLGHYTAEILLGENIFHCNDDQYTRINHRDAKACYILLYQELKHLKKKKKKYKKRFLR